VDRFPRAYTVAFLLIGGSLLVGGFLLWWPQRVGPSTAKSDLGLTLLGGALALFAGFVVARAVFGAERRFDAALRASEERRERESLALALSIAGTLDGADLHGRDLSRLRLHEKTLDGANLREATLRESEFLTVGFREADLRNADLRDARFTVGLRGAHCSLYRAQLQGADLRGAILRADLRRADLRGADLRGADLSWAVLKHSTAGEEAQLAGARYDDKTLWPEGINPEAWGAVRGGTERT